MDETLENTTTEVENEAENNASEDISQVEGAESAESSSYTPDDSILERAIKAGMTLGDARSFSSKEQAERFIGMLEGKKSGNDANTEANGDDFPAIDFGGFSEEDGYDPNIVKAMNSLKGVIEAQAKVIKSLKAGKTAETKTKAVESRKNLILARPGGEKGRGSSDTKADAEADAIASLRRKFKLN